MPIVKATGTNGVQHNFLLDAKDGDDPFTRTMQAGFQKIEGLSDWQARRLLEISRGQYTLHVDADGDVRFEPFYMGPSEHIGEDA